MSVEINYQDNTIYGLDTLNVTTSIYAPSVVGTISSDNALLSSSIITSTDTTKVPFSVIGLSGQSANLVQLKDYNGLIISDLDADGGALFTGSVVVSGGANNITGADFLCYGAVNPINKISEFRDDFISSTVAGDLGWAAVNSGTAAGSSVTTTFGYDSTNKAYGVVVFTTGTTLSGRANLNLGTDLILFGYGEFFQRWRFALSALSTILQTYQVRVGYIDSTTNAEPTDGAYFEYDTATSPNWRICTASNGTRTKTTTNTVVQATAFSSFWIYVNAAGTRVDYYIDNIFVGSVTTNIPTGAGRYTGIGIIINKSLGITANLLYLDYFYNKYVTTRI